MSVFKTLRLAAVCLALGTGAQAAQFKIEFSGSNATGFASGSWLWDDTVPGASSDPTSVSLNDAGISEFQMLVGIGTATQSFSISDIFATTGGAFDLSPTTGSSDIVGATVCLQETGGNNICGFGNSQDIAVFNSGGTIGFILDGNGRNVAVTYTVTDITTPVPLPASALMLLGGLGAVAGLRRRKRARAP